MESNIYIDDVMQGCIGKEHQMERWLPVVAMEAWQVIDEVLESSIALGKVGVVASDKPLLEHLRSQLGCLVGAKTVSTRSLGMDCRAGRKTGGLMLVRSKRFRLLKKRTKKFCKLVAVVGQKASNIFTAGLLLASNFGMEVHGVADRQRPQRPRPTKEPSHSWKRPFRSRPSNRSRPRPSDRPSRSSRFLPFPQPLA